MIPVFNAFALIKKIDQMSSHFSRRARSPISINVSHVPRRFCARNLSLIHSPDRYFTPTFCSRIVLEREKKNCLIMKQLGILLTYVIQDDSKEWPLSVSATDLINDSDFNLYVRKPLCVGSDIGG